MRLIERILGRRMDVDERLRARAEQARDTCLLVLHQLSSPSSQSPFRFEAQRVLDGIDSGLITLLAQEGSLGSGPSIKLLKFECQFGRHVNPVILMDLRQIEVRSDEGLMLAATNLLRNFRELRGNEVIGKGVHVGGFCKREEVTEFVQNRSLIWV